MAHIFGQTNAVVFVGDTFGILFFLHRFVHIKRVQRIGNIVQKYTIIIRRFNDDRIFIIYFVN